MSIVEVDDFNDVGYNMINTTGKKGYNELKREVMTWDDIKYLNQVRCTYLSSKDFYIYKMLDNETHDIIVYKPVSDYSKEQYNEIRRAYRRGFDGDTVSVSKVIEYIRNSINDNSNLSRNEQGQLDINVDVDVEALRGKRNDNRRGIAENDSNDNLQKRESRTVEEKELTKLTKENAELRQAVTFLKQEIKTGHFASKTQLQSIARDMKKKYDSKIDTVTLVGKLNNLFNEIANNPENTWDNTMDLAKNIVKMV